MEKEKETEKTNLSAWSDYLNQANYPGVEAPRLERQQGVYMRRKGQEAHVDRQAEEAHVARIQRQTAAQANIKTMIFKLPLPLDPAGLFPQGEAKSLEDKVDKGSVLFIGKGTGSFGGVCKALARVEERPDSIALLGKLEQEAQDWLDERGQEEKESEDWRTKQATCQALIEKARRLRNQLLIADGCEAVKSYGDPPWDPQQEAVVNRLRSRLCLAAGRGKKLDDDDGAGKSDSFFLCNSDDEPEFIFKPSDGEHNAGYGWKPGGGAAREFMASVLSDTVREATGLDLRVAPTTLVTLDDPSLGSEKNRNRSRRTGAIQNFVRKDNAATARLKGKDATLVQEVRSELEGAVLLDLMTLQADRQPDNVLVTTDDTGAPHIVPIDAGNSMPPRKAFEAVRRAFGQNCLLQLLPPDEPLSQDARSAIEKLDPDAIADALLRAQDAIAASDPALNGAVDRKEIEMVRQEEIEMVRRSIKFLKRAASQLTVKQLTEAYEYTFQGVLDAKLLRGSKPDQRIDEAIDQALGCLKKREELFRRLEKRGKYVKELTELGWPAEHVAFLKDDPKRLLRILKNNEPCPGAIREIQKLRGSKRMEAVLSDLSVQDPRVQHVRGMIKALGGGKKLRFGPRKPSCNELWSELRGLADVILMNDPEIQDTAKRHGANLGLHNAKEVRNFVKWGGDERLKEAIVKYGVQVDGEMTWQTKLDVFRIDKFNRLGGMAKLKELVALGYNEADRDPTKDGKWDLVCQTLTAWKKFKALGGEDEYVRLGLPQGLEVSLFRKVEFLKAMTRAKT